MLYAPYTSTHRVTFKNERDMVTESRGKYVGPMPPETWLKRFMPAPQGQKRPRVSFEAVIAAAVSGGEIDMYPAFLDVCRALNRAQDNMFFADTHAKCDPRTIPSLDPDSERKGATPDVMFYFNDSLPHANRPTDFSRGDVPGEFKIDEDSDPFCDDLDGDRRCPFEDVTERGMDTRGQITRYASAILQLQYRHFCFSFVLFGRYARLIRWDRSGAVVTRAFGYVENPEPLADFVWRYGFLTREQRGLDEHVVEITPTVAASIPKLSNVRTALGRSARDNLFLLRMTPLPAHLSDTASSASSFLHNGHDDRFDGWDYIVSSPEYHDRGPFGRATRSLYVYERFCGRICHLKDTWRVDSPDHEVEHEILEKLHQKNVPHIATVHEARQFYDTMTPIYATFPGVGSNIANVPHRLYRLISEEIGRALWDFHSSKELVQVIIDALEAHQMAEKAGYRHRDISVGNILITNDSRALLIDWDASKKIALMNESKGSIPNQTGTWQFISLARLLDFTCPHLLLDELESFFWVLLWIALRFCRHTLTDVRLANIMQNIFDDASSALEPEQLMGGTGKIAVLNIGLQNFLRTEFEPPSLQSVITSMCEVLAQRYRTPVALTAKDKELAVLRADEDRWENKLKMHDLAVEQHKDAMDDLKDATWMRERLQWLLDKDDWPEDDKAVANPLCVQDERPRKRSDKSESAVEYWESREALVSRLSKRVRTEAEDARRGEDDSDASSCD